MKRVLYLLIVSLLVANCWQPSDKKKNNEVTQANDIKENPKEDFGEEEMSKQSNDTIITPKDVQVNEDGTIFYDHHRLIYIEKISELIKKVENTEIFKFKEIYRCNINEDELEDMILAFDNKYTHFSATGDIDWTVAPVIVLLNKGDNLYKMSYNSTIYPNSFGDHFGNISIKNNFFTIELFNQVLEKYDSEKYITFKYDEQKKDIFLHRYGEIINWWESKPTNTQLTKKDFGEISFEEYDEDMIKELVYKVKNK